MNRQDVYDALMILWTAYAQNGRPETEGDKQLLRVVHYVLNDRPFEGRP